MNTSREDGTISWNTFMTQFERLTERKDWSKRKRTHMILCFLEGSILKYVCKLKFEKYRHIKKEMIEI